MSFKTTIKATSTIDQIKKVLCDLEDIPVDTCSLVAVNKQKLANTQLYPRKEDITFLDPKLSVFNALDIGSVRELVDYELRLWSNAFEKGKDYSFLNRTEIDMLFDMIRWNFINSTEFFFPLLSKALLKLGTLSFQVFLIHLIYLIV